MKGLPFTGWLLALTMGAMLCAKAQILPPFGDSRTGTTGMQFLKITPDARAAGLAGTYLALADDVAALYWNPAGITRIDTPAWHLQAGHTAYWAGINMAFGGIVHRLSANRFIGGSLVFLNTGQMAVTTEFHPFGTGQTYRATDLAAGLTYAQILTDNFSFGLTAKYVRESILDINSNSFVVDFGFQYEVGKANTRFAVGVANFGFNTQPKGQVAVPQLTGTDTITDFEEIAVPAVFRLGIAWDAIKRQQHHLTLAGQLNHPTDNNETYSLGTEYTWKKLLAARLGYEFAADERGAPAFGFGIRYQRSFGIVRLDYGFVHKARLGMVHRFSLAVGFF